MYLTNIKEGIHVIFFLLPHQNISASLSLLCRGLFYFSYGLGNGYRIKGSMLSVLLQPTPPPELASVEERESLTGDLMCVTTKYPYLPQGRRRVSKANVFRERHYEAKLDFQDW